MNKMKIGILVCSSLMMSAAGLVSVVPSGSVSAIASSSSVITGPSEDENKTYTYLRGSLRFWGSWKSWWDRAKGYHREVEGFEEYFRNIKYARDNVLSHADNDNSDASMVTKGNLTLLREAVDQGDSSKSIHQIVIRLEGIKDDLEKIYSDMYSYWAVSEGQTDYVKREIEYTSRILDEYKSLDGQRGYLTRIANRGRGIVW